MKIQAVKHLPAVVTTTLLFQARQAFEYLLAHGDATIDELKNIGIKNPSATIYDLRCHGLDNCIKAVPAHYIEVPSANGPYRIKVPFKYVLDWSFCVEGVWS